MIVRTTIYVNRSKDSNWETWYELWEEHRPPESMGGPPDEAGRRFSYAAYEIAIDVEVNLMTGEAKAVKFGNQYLPEKETIT